MRRLLLLTAAVLVPLVPATPAYATATVICVDLSGGSCNQTVGTIHEAINAAGGTDAIVLVAPGTYTESPYVLNGSVNALTLKGSGEGSTFLTMPDSATSQVYLDATQATVQDLTIRMTDGANSSNDIGLDAHSGATVDHVTVDGTGGVGTTNAIGMRSGSSTITRSRSLMPLNSSVSENWALYSIGGTTVTDTVLVGDAGFRHSGPGTTDTASRVRITASAAGVATDSGSVDVDDALIDLGSNASAVGLEVANFNNSTTAKSIDANHVTIVGGGSGSIGAYAWANGGTSVQQASITLANSIVRDPETDLLAIAGNNGGLGGTSTATITATYSDWQLGTSTSNANGYAHVANDTGNVDADPGFVNAGAGDYRLSTTSPVIDLGDPAPGGPVKDLAGAARVVDGNDDGVAVRDMGAYEHPQPAVVVTDTTAPDTRITSHPRKRTTKRRVTFRFVSSESGSRFQCKIDRHSWESCSSPKSYRVKVGRHRFRVRAIDSSGNLDATPALFRFRRL